MSQSRQLAAIMFTDIVGYTALMGKDSNKALELVRISKEIQKPLVEKHHGQWLKEMGDGALAKFNTALDAVNCSIAIQEIARGKLDAKLRIGIHLGDITIENDDVYGDGVNVASRLESIADPGGIYISDNVEKSIRGQTNVQAKYLGEIKLKNVDYGVRTYAVQGVGLPIPEVKEDKELSGHFLAEVQRRGVIQAGVTYVVLSLLLILLLPYATSVVNLPRWSSIALLSILIACFPVALYLAWNYERSPEGFVRTSSRESWQNPLKPSQRKPLTGTFIIAGLVLVIVIMFFYPRFQSSGQESEISESVPKSSVMDKSIAVLPFVNMSNDPDQDYFSDGMMEEILNHLVKIEDLKVISRTTSMRFKGSTRSINEIAEELGVSTVLEGSVRKEGNQVRITVQLIQGATDMHLWSESYDRQLDNIFEVQSDVAQRIAQILQAEVSPEVKLRIESQPTRNSEAYDYYLKGLREGEKNYDKQLEYYEKAIELDPDFAAAYSAVGRWKLNEGGWAGTLSAQEATDLALPYIEKAIVLDPYDAEAYLALADLALYFKWDFEEAGKNYQKAIELSPSDPMIQSGTSDYLLASGQSEIALLRNQRTIASGGGRYDGLALAQYFTDQHADALETIDTYLIVDKIDNDALMAARIYVGLNMYREVVELFENINPTDPGLNAPRTLGLYAVGVYHTGHLEKTNEVIDILKQKSSTSSVGSPASNLAIIYGHMGQIDTAFKWLEKGYDDHEVEMYWIKVEPALEPLRSDPRWQEILDKVGFPK